MQRERAPAVALAIAFGLLWAALPLERQAGPPASVPPPRIGAARLLWGLPLDLNREAQESLEALPGIGPMRAHAIRAARPFCHVSELRRVPGIGPVTLSRLAGRVAVPRQPSVCRD